MVTITHPVQAEMVALKLGARLRLIEEVVLIPTETSGPILMTIGPSVFLGWDMAMLGHQIPTNGVTAMVIHMGIHIHFKSSRILG